MSYVLFVCVLALGVQPTLALESAVLTQAVKVAANSALAEKKKRNDVKQEDGDQVKEVQGEDREVNENASDKKDDTTDTQQDNNTPQTSQLQEKAVAKTALESAFGQLGQLAGEFGQLHQDDNAHVNKLLFHMHLRDQLRQKIAQEEDTIKADDEKLVAGINAVKGNGTVTVAGLEGLIQNTTAATGASSSVASSALTAAISLLARERYQVSSTEQQLAKETLGSLQRLEEQIGQVRAKDREELEVLKSNANNRQKLKAMIKAQQERLDVDSVDLAGSLSKIEQMALPSDSSTTAATTIAPAMEKAPQSAASIESSADASTAASSTESVPAAPSSASAETTEQS